MINRSEQLPPGGTLTFLFTDIESSTQLWEKYPDAMKSALARHDALLRQAIENHHGVVFKTVGDGFYAVFSDAPVALRAALTAQRALRAASWGQTPIKVRMALHIGAAEARDGDYFGPPLNRLARLLSTGYGGQTLLSAAATEAVREHLPQDAELRDKGKWHLKDLTCPEHIYQLLVPDLPAEFPPLKTLDAFHTNLPAQLTSFVGREKEIVAVKQLFAPSPFPGEPFRQERGRAGEGARLVTLTGPGGTGKTRLSLQVAADLLDSFPDGVWLIELAPLADPALVAQTVASTLGLREETGRPLLDVLTDHLRPKKVLLVLDNCEHLVEAAAQFAETFLQACPNLRLLVSSREALGIAGETTYRVPSLSIPDIHKLPTVETLTQYEAARLFIDRAKTALPAYTLTNENAPAVAQICFRLDGIPLAIELAAARVKMLKVEQIAERLDDRFRLLTGGSRTALPRQQTLRALIDWSYDLLSAPERALLRRLSVFAGGWTLEAAETVCADKDENEKMKDEGSSKDGVLHPLAPDRGSSFILHPFDVLDLLTQLVNKSLVVVDADGDAETRYRLLETVRQYAREKLAEAGEGAPVRHQHMEYFLSLAECAELELTGPWQETWLKRLDHEVDNSRAALEWSMKQDAQVGLRLASALGTYWFSAGLRVEGLDWLSQLLRQPSASARNEARAKALVALSFFNIGLIPPIEIQPLAEAGLAIYRELDDQRGIARALYALGSVICFQEAYPVGRPFLFESLALYKTLDIKLGMADVLAFLGWKTDYQNYAQARAYLEESLTLYRALGHTAGITTALNHLGWLALQHGDYVASRNWLTQSLELNRGLGSLQMAHSLNVLGMLDLKEGNYQQASHNLDESLSLSHERGLSELWAITTLGYTALRQGDTTRARRLFEEGQPRFKEMGITIGVVYALEGLASLAVLQGQAQPAAQLFAWADGTREAVNNIRPLGEQTDVDRDLAAIHTQLDEAACAAAQAAGRAMSMDEAIALALETNKD